MGLIIYDKDTPYDIPVDLDKIWGINVYDHDGAEAFEVIYKDFDVSTYQTDGSRENPLTRCYSIGPTEIAAWNKGRVRA